jgi:multiple sugar transport system substrate-binding protein
MSRDTDSQAIRLDELSRRRLLKAAGAAGTTGMLAGCLGSDGTGSGRNDNGTSGGSNSDTNMADSVKLTVSGWASSDTESKLLKQLISDFEASHQKINVNYSPVQGKYKQKIKTQLGAGNAPDVFYVDSSYFASFAKSGVLLNLSPYVEQADDYNLDPIYDSVVEAFRWDGKLYGLPKGISTLGYFYNTAMYEEAGLSKPPETWNELRSQLKTIKRSGVGVDAPMIEFGTPRTFWPFLYQNGGQVLTDDGSKCVVGSKECIEALEFIVQLHKDGLIAIPTELSSSWHGQALGTQEVASGVTGTWAIPYLDSKFPQVFGDIDVAHLPIPKNGQKATMAYTVSWSAAAKTKTPDAAWKYIKYFTSKEGMRKWAKSGLGLAGRKTLADMKYYQKNPRKKTLLEGAEWSHVWGFGANSETILNIIKPQLQGAMLGEISPSKALTTAQQQINAQVL